MHSLAEYTYAEIRAAVLSFIQAHETGTYALDKYWLKFNRTDNTYKAVFAIGCQVWKFQYAAAEVEQPGSLN